MQLYRRLGVRRRWFRRPLYQVYLRLEGDDDEHALLRRNRVLEDELYASPYAEDLDTRTLSALELAEQTDDGAKARGLRLQALRLAREAMAEPRLTVGEALVGKSFAAETVAEISMLIGGVVSSVKGLAQQHALLIAIEDGEENVTAGAEPEAASTSGPWAWFSAKRN